jgi:hypothetical protein
MFVSIFQLRVDSVERYASEWARCRNWLKKRLGDGVILPVIPLSASGVEDKTVVRGLLDLAAWYESLQDPDLKLFRNTRKGWEDTYLGKKSRGQG